MPIRHLNAVLTKLGPGLRTVMLGGGAGILVLLAMTAGLDPAQRTAPTNVAASAEGGSIRKPDRQAAGPSAVSGGVFYLFLPPRKAASNLTWRIENGLPRVEPAAIPVPAPTTAMEARPSSIAADEPGAPRIAIVIDDMGFDRKNSTRAVGLPAAVTLAYLPFAPSVDRQVRTARRSGHQVMLHLPMEADDHKGRPGRKILSIANDEGEIRSRLTEMLRDFSGYIGVNNHQGSLFTRDRGRMELVLGELKRRGLFFLDSRTSGGSVGAEVAADISIAHAVRDVFLDHDPAPELIAARMQEAETIAREKGHAIVIGHPRDATMDRIEPWIASLEQRGFRLVPVSELLVRPTPREPKKLAQIGTGE